MEYGVLNLLAIIYEILNKVLRKSRNFNLIIEINTNTSIVISQ